MPRRLDPEGREYMKRATELAFSYVPRIYPCADCGNPVITGYCCTYCHSAYPEQGTPKEREAVETSHAR